MPEKPKAIVLGGTSPHIELIKKLKQRGYFTILVDYYENPTAKEHADQHIQESTLDKEKVLEIAKQHHAELVISSCVDQANVTACYVAERMGLPRPYSYDTALSISVKANMKNVMAEHEIPTAAHQYVSDYSELNLSALSYPLIVKPANSAGSAGVKKVVNENFLREYLKQALTISRTNKAIVEEFKEGKELSVYAFITNGKANILMMAERVSVIDGENEVLKCIATLAPAGISETATTTIQNICDKIASAYQLDNSPLHVQVLVDGDTVNTIEFAPRAGGGFSYQTIKLNTGFDIIDASIDSFLNKTVAVNYSRPSRKIAIILLYAKPALFGEIKLDQSLIDDRVVHDYHYHKTRGMQIGDEKAGSARVGAVLVQSETWEGLRGKVQAVSENIQAYDIGGNPILRRDLISYHNIISKNKNLL